MSADDPFPNVSANRRRYRAIEKQRRRAELAALLAIPAPRLAATETGVLEPYVTRGITSVGKVLSAAGWRWRLTRAVGPRINARGEVVENECATLVIAAMSPGNHRIIWEWRWVNDAWKFVDALDLTQGALLNAEEAKAVVKGANA